MEIKIYHGAVAKYLHMFDLEALWLFWEACKRNGVESIVTDLGDEDGTSFRLTKPNAWKEFIYMIDGGLEEGYIECYTKDNQRVATFAVQVYQDLDSYECFLYDYTVQDIADKIWHEVYNILDKRFTEHFHL